jgi:DNA-directed RNA polymerase subunit M
MKFCKECKTLMVPNEKGNLECSNCGKTTRTKQATIVEKIEKKKQTKKVEEQDIKETMPVADAECPKCGNPKAFNWSEQTRAADEPETQFYRCTKCRYTWREYD